MKYFIIANPVADQGNARLVIPQVEEQLKSLGLDFVLIQTERRGHAIELAREGVEKGYGCIVAAGGDGTLNEVINGLMLVKQPGVDLPCLGVLTIGRGNDFAFGMGVPHDWREGCQALKDSQRRWIDVGHVISEFFPDGRYFGNGVGSGFDTIVGFEAAKMTRVHGMVSYLLAAGKTIFLFKAPLLKIELDNETITQNCALVSIMNGRRMGGSFMMAPDSLQDDGLFDLCITANPSRLQTVMLLPKFMNGTQGQSPLVRYCRSRVVKISAVEGTIPAHADGETLCTEGKSLQVELLPRQLQLIYRPVQSV